MHFKILQSFCVDYFIITFRIQKIDQWQSVPWAWVHCKSFCSSRPLTPCSLSCHSSSPCRSVHLLLVPNMWSYHWRLVDQTFRVSQLEKTAMYVPTLNFWVGQVVWPHLSEVLSLKKKTQTPGIHGQCSMCPPPRVPPPWHSSQSSSVLLFLEQQCST